MAGAGGAELALGAGRPLLPPPLPEDLAAGQADAAAVAGSRLPVHPVAEPHCSGLAGHQPLVREGTTAQIPGQRGEDPEAMGGRAPRYAHSTSCSLACSADAPAAGRACPPTEPALRTVRSTGLFGAGAARDTDCESPPSGQARAGPSAQSPRALPALPSPPRSPALRARHPPPPPQTPVTLRGPGAQRGPPSGWSSGPGRLGPPGG
jgi:hypothetical protein